VAWVTGDDHRDPVPSSAQGTTLGGGQVAARSADDGDVDVEAIERTISDRLETTTRRRRLGRFAADDRVAGCPQLTLGRGTDTGGALDQ
jgi:hypothetical protein